MDRRTRTVVHWCPNEKCPLYGVDNKEEECPKCFSKIETWTWVLVATDKTNVFMGLAREASLVKPEDASPEWCPRTLNMCEVRMCLIWDNVDKGVLGLASHGPSNLCRISAAVPEATIDLIHGIAFCTAQAIEAWQSEPWKP